MTPADDLNGDWAAVRAAFEPIRRTGQLSRYRVLDVACPAGHRLLQLIGTPRGPVIVSRSEALVYGQAGPPRWRRRAVQDVVPLEAWPQPTYTAQCRCRTATIPTAWIREQLEAGTHRAEWTSTTTTTRTA